MQTIGFIGPGIMGAPMIQNLAEAGYRVRAFGRSDASRARIRDGGGIVAASAIDAAHGADIIVTMLPDSPDVHEVVLGEGGLAEELSAGQVYIDMSTIRPDLTREIHQVLSKQGVDMLDAPVSGGQVGAEQGRLSIMVGGQAAVLEQVRDVLETMGSTITHVGPAGAGQLTKAANQMIVAANIQAVCEAIVLLESAGADVGQALAAIGGGLAGSAVLQGKREAFLTGSFDPGFRLALHNKDMRIVTSAAEQAGIGLPVTGLVSHLMAAAAAKGYGERDHSVLLRAARELNAAD